MQGDCPEHLKAGVREGSKARTHLRSEAQRGSEVRSQADRTEPRSVTGGRKQEDVLEAFTRPPRSPPVCSAAECQSPE